MFITIIKAFVIGVCASIPLGPIAILVIQKSLVYGRRSGFVTGLGATTVDMGSAVIAVFALDTVKKFIELYTSAIMIAGGGVVAMVGISMLRSKLSPSIKHEQKSTVLLNNYLQAFITALSNPGVVFLMLGLFTFVKIDVPNDFSFIFVILAVGAGSVIYWFFISWLMANIGKCINFETITLINKIAGGIILAIAIGFVTKGLISFFNTP